MLEEELEEDFVECARDVCVIAIPAKKLLLWNTHGGHSVRPHAPTTPLGSETRDTPHDATSMSACARQPPPASAAASARDETAAIRAELERVKLQSQIQLNCSTRRSSSFSNSAFQNLRITSTSL